MSDRRGGRWVRLDLVRPADYGELYELMLSGRAHLGWRFRGQTPDPDSFVQIIWQGVAAQFVVRDLDHDQLLGLVSCFDAVPEDGYAHVGVVLAEKGPMGAGMEAVLMLLDHVFGSFAFRKVYFHIPEFNLERVAAVKRLLDEEGVLRNHTFREGRYWDEHIFSLTRERWDEAGPSLLTRTPSTVSANGG